MPRDSNATIPWPAHQGFPASLVQVAGPQPPISKMASFEVDLIETRCAGPQPPAGKQAARVQLRNSHLISAIGPASCQPIGSRPRPDRRPMEAVRHIRLATCGAAHGSPMLPTHRGQDTENVPSRGKASRPVSDAAGRRRRARYVVDSSKRLSSTPEHARTENPASCEGRAGVAGSWWWCTDHHVDASGAPPYTARTRRTPAGHSIQQRRGP